MPFYESFAHQCLLCVRVLSNGQAKCTRDFPSRRRVKHRVQSLQATSLSLPIPRGKRVEGISGHCYFFIKEGRHIKVTYDRSLSPILVQAYLETRGNSYNTFQAHTLLALLLARLGILGSLPLHPHLTPFSSYGYPPAETRVLTCLR